MGLYYQRKFAYRNEMDERLPMKYTVARINLLPLAKFGFLLGAVAMLLPSLICAFGLTQAVWLLRQTLDGWANAETDMLGFNVVAFNFIELLGLENMHQLLTQLTDQALMFGLLIILGCIIGGGLLIGGIVWLVGICYNLLAKITGGVEVELQSL